MASPGDKFREVWTADFYNRVNGMLVAFQKISGTNGVQVSSGKTGIQISLSSVSRPVSTLQGVLAGGTPSGVTDGAVILDLAAFDPYAIQAGAFVLFSGTCTVSVLVGTTPISWLNNIAVSTTLSNTPISVPAPDLTNVVARGAQLSIVISGSSGDAAGLNFSLNAPF